MIKKTFTVLALSVMVWGCAKKTTATTSTTAPASNSGSVSVAPAIKAESTVTNATGTAAIPAAKPEGTKSPVETASPEMLGQGTYNAKCGRCHGLKVTTDYTSDRWVSIMQAMAPKAHLDATEKENVLAYVRANSKK
jgi:cytochrome c5